MLRAASAREEGMDPIFGEWDGSEIARTISGQGARRMNAAVPIERCLALSN
jgi:hypothetical protein